MPGQGSGHGLASVETVMNAGSGYLMGDVFVVRLSMRIALPGNERLSVVAKHKAVEYTVRNCTWSKCEM